MDTKEVRVKLLHIGIEKATTFGLERAWSIAVGMIESVGVYSLFWKFAVGISPGLKKIPQFRRRFGIPGPAAAYIW